MKINKNYLKLIILFALTLSSKAYAVCDFKTAEYIDKLESPNSIKSIKYLNVRIKIAQDELKQQQTNMILDQGLKKYGAEFPSLEMKQFYSTRIKVQRTPPKGGFHIWHCEHHHGEASTRLLTWTIYLNDIPKGEGETEFLEYGITIQPKKGSVCFFPASFTHTHRGNPVYKHNKYIATGWYYLAQ